AAWLAPRAAATAALPLLLAGVALPAWAAHHAQAWAQQQAHTAEQRRTALLQPLAAITALLQWGQWARFAQRFQQQDLAHQTIVQAQHRWQRRVLLGQRLGLALAAGLLLWQGATAVAQRSISAALLLALLLALFGLGEALQALGQQVMALGLARAAQDRLNALLQASVSPQESATRLEPPPAAQQPITLDIDNLSARHRGALNGVEHLDLHLQAGDVLWVQGPSGAGKSTLLAVLAGELEPLSGDIRAWNRPYAHIDWNGRLGYLGQTLDVFDLTLAENLRLGQTQASDADLWRVLEQVALADWARALPQQLDTLVGEYGATLSGGQARRVALARLLLKPQDLLLLDEPLAGLDETNRHALLHQLQEHQRHGILIIVSHHAVALPGVRHLRIGD
ncbi:MAG: ATP-binding cassette domain-containing protein, partial [Brachymonas sp.]|nr:ATP-binding cassette domain-containing protein [Brachymonas sp.]